MKLKATTLKRKRQEQQVYRVRFNDVPVEHITYSSDEYDRGGIFSFPVLYKINPTLLQQQPSSLPEPPKLTLNTTSLTTTNNQDDDEDNNSNQSSPQTPSDEIHVLPSTASSPIKKPKLTINTNLIGGPLFLTQLTTHSSSHQQEDSNDFLVPMSAYL